jgi:hypothetical protein
MNKRFTLGVALVATLSVFGTSAVLAQDEDAAGFTYELPPVSASNFDVVPNTEMVDGQPITAWIERLDAWFALTPFDQHFGPTGNCQAAQGGPVFFLANVPFGMTAVYDCVIEPDQNILVWVGGGFGWSEDESPESVFGQSLDNAMMLFNPQLLVDGRSVPVGGSAWFQREPYTWELEEGNLVGEPAGTYNVASNGWYLMLEPLEPGPHTIIISDDTLQSAISPLDLGSDSAEGPFTLVDDPRFVAETMTATAVFNITVPESEAAAE